MLAVTEYQSLSEIEVLRYTWDTLWGKTFGASFVQSYSAFESVCRSLDSSCKIKVLLVTLMGKPVGIVPLVIRPVSTPVGTLRSLEYPLQDWFSFYGAIGAHKTIVLQAAVKHLKKSKRDWDYIDLRGYEHLGREEERVWNAGRVHGLRLLRREDRGVAAADLNQGWHAYWTGRNSELRERFGRIEKRLEEMGKIKLVRSRAVATLRSRTIEESAQQLSTFQHLTELNEEVINRKVDGRDERRGVNLWRFIRDVHASAVTNAVADWSVLYVEDEPVAAAYGLARQGQIEILSLVVSPQWPQAAQQVLMKMLLEDSCSRGDVRVIFSSPVRHCVDDFKTTEIARSRLTCQPVSAWKLHAWKALRIANQKLGRSQNAIGFFDEDWVERRKSNPAAISIAPGVNLDVVQ